MSDDDNKEIVEGVVKTAVPAVIGTIAAGIPGAIIGGIIGLGIMIAKQSKD